MNTVYLAPHNDDEVLWGTYTLLAHRPHVVVVLRSYRELLKHGVTAALRGSETACAMEVLGCTWEQWGFLDSDPDWDAVEAELRTLDADWVFAPAWERDGHEQHNRVAELADKVFGGCVTSYMTYTPAGKSLGRLVPSLETWALLKARALACYPSQSSLPDYAPHFTRDQTEYYQ